MAHFSLYILFYHLSTDRLNDRVGHLELAQGAVTGSTKNFFLIAPFPDHCLYYLYLSTKGPINETKTCKNIEELILHMQHVDFLMMRLI